MSDATTMTKGGNTSMTAAYMMLIACAMMWGSNHVVARGVNATVPLEALAFWRWVVAAVLLLPVCIPHLKRDLKLMAHHKMSMFLIGTTGVFLFSIIIYLAAYNTTAVNTGLLNATTPVWVLLFAALLTADKPKIGQWAGVLIAGVGTAVIIAKGNFAVFADMDFVSGDLFALVSAMVWAAYSMLLKRAPRGVHPLSLVFVSALIGLVFLTPLYIWSVTVKGQPFFTHLDPAWPDMIKIFYIGVGPAFLGYLFWNKGVAVVGPANAGVFLYLMPVFASVLAIIFLGEELHLYHLGGIALIAFGIWQATRRKA
ncbi:DMT family transporter [Thalassospira alkalitolerans]|uniref:DMT family transporter n=1 Tax=Thalassospira alkalitolerans TaxID=1293890 RepID=UPI003AA9B38B